MAILERPPWHAKLDDFIWKKWFDDLRATVNILISGGSTITTKDEGTTLSSSVTTLDFVGAGVTASGGGATTTINIPGGGSSTITTKDEGSTLSTTVTTLDFVGSGVTASGGGATTTVAVPGAGSSGGQFNWAKYIAGRFMFRYG